jgi:hypothetical protein
VRVPAAAAEFLLELGGFMATRDAENRPTAVEAVVLELDAESGIAEVAANVRFARNTVGNLRANGRCAVVISRAWADHRSVQIKGRCLDVRGPVLDPERIGPRTEVLAKVLVTFGLPQKVADDFRKIRYDPHYLVKVQIDDVFDQTPGPGAGRRVQ